MTSGPRLAYDQRIYRNGRLQPHPLAMDAYNRDQARSRANATARRLVNDQTPPSAADVAEILRGMMAEMPDAELQQLFKMLREMTASVSTGNSRNSDYPKEEFSSFDAKSRRPGPLRQPATGRAMDQAMPSFRERHPYIKTQVR